MLSPGSEQSSGIVLRGRHGNSAVVRVDRYGEEGDGFYGLGYLCMQQRRADHESICRSALRIFSFLYSSSSSVCGWVGWTGQVDQALRPHLTAVVDRFLRLVVGETGHQELLSGSRLGGRLSVRTYPIDYVRTPSRVTLMAMSTLSQSRHTQ